MLRGSRWWIGDWLLYGSARWGERYVEASRVTGYEPKSLRNMRYVSSPTYDAEGAAGNGPLSAIRLPLSGRRIPSKAGLVLSARYCGAQ
jgi:hypothetical protein